MPAHSNPIPEQGVSNQGVFECIEARLGRSDWTVADYRAAGHAAFPSMGLHESLRAETVKIYVKLNCPPAKLRAHVAETNAQFNLGDGM